MAAAGLRRVLRGPRLSRCMSLLRVQARHCRPCGKCHNSTPSLGVQRLRLGSAAEPSRSCASSIARSHNMAGEARPCLDLRGVFLD